LRWFGHVRRRPQQALVRRVEALIVDGTRRRGRPKLRWDDRLKLDMKKLLMSEDVTLDRNAWRDRIRISGWVLAECVGHNSWAWRRKPSGNWAWIDEFVQKAMMLMIRPLKGILGFLEGLLFVVGVLL
ncbi:hypothetical protein Tco_1542176, partial [Tanacetum coccineum]